MALICCVEEHMQPYDFICVWIPDLHFGYALLQKHKVKGLIQTGADVKHFPLQVLYKRLDYRLELL